MARTAPAGSKTATRTARRWQSDRVLFGTPSASATPLPPKVGLARLAVSLGPAETIALDQIRGSNNRARFARGLIERLVRQPGAVRDQLRRAEVAPLPEDRRDQTRLDVRMPAALREKLDRWVGQTDLGQILRAAILAEAAGVLGTVESEPTSRTRRASTAPTSATTARSSRSSRSLPARATRPSPENAEPDEHGQATPRRRARRSPPRPRPPRPRTPPAPPAPSAEELALQAVVDRVRRQRESQFAYDPMIEDAIGSRADAESIAASPNQTLDLLGDIDDGADGILLAPAWTPAAALEVARLLADRPARTEHRILVGVDRELNGVGIEDPGGVGEAVVRLARRIGRESRVRVLRHYVEGDEQPVWVVEVRVELR